MVEQPTDFPPIDPMSDELSELLNEWHAAKAQANEWAAKETALRLRIFGGLFPTPVPGAGNKVKIPYNMALIGTYRLNYRVDEAAMSQSRSLIEPATFEEVITFKPSVRDGAFRALPDADRNLFVPFVTVSPGTPGIELKPADKVRWK